MRFGGDEFFFEFVLENISEVLRDVGGGDFLDLLDVLVDIAGCDLGVFEQVKLGEAVGLGDFDGAVEAFF